MLYINGTWKPAADEATFEVTNPANGDHIADVADGSAPDIDAAIDAADCAFDEWAGLTAYQRSGYLQDAYRLMMERQDVLAKVMTEEQGKPLRTAAFEIQYAAEFFLWYAEETKRVYGELIPAPRADQRLMVIHQPVGVVGAITPWNYPSSMITRKLAPALAAGCTFVVKPAEQTPLSAIEVFKILDEVGLPAGVANLVTTGKPEPVGDAFTTDPRVKKLTFTGSTEVGKRLASAAAGNMKRISLELGGHAPFIVFDDVDPVHAAKGASLVKFLNMGQACISPNRIYVHRDVVEEFTAALADRVAGMKMGSGLTPEVGIGPLVDERAINKVQRQVDDAVAKGAEVRIGGKRGGGAELDKGFFFEPTVLAGVTEQMNIYRKETFGPVAAVIEFETEEEVVEKANDTVYGLAAYVYTDDLARATRMFEGLNFGIIGVNDINPTAVAAPFGGMKESGIGREGGREGIMEFLETKVGGFSIR